MAAAAWTQRPRQDMRPPSHALQSESETRDSQEFVLLSPHAVAKWHRRAAGTLTAFFRYNNL
jgi:hypothetical protein